MVSVKYSAASIQVVVERWESVACIQVVGRWEFVASDRLDCSLFHDFCERILFPRKIQHEGARNIARFDSKVLFYCHLKS